MSDNRREVLVSRSHEVVPFNNFELYLQELGLPHEGIIAPDSERNTMQMILPQTIQQLSPQTKKDAVYLSKFVASSAIGLHDAALNYLWNEVVVSLREKVKIYGLDLFFDAAVGGDLRETYNTEEDLSLIKDNTLVDTCRKLELISDILHEKLKHILFMRNNIGASHPNGETIRTLELLGWLETCVKDVIDDRPSEAALFVQQLVVNLKKDNIVLDQPRLEQIYENLQQQHSRISGNLLITLFSIFTKQNTLPNVRDNILKLAPIVWAVSPENKKYEIGFKLDQFSVNLDEPTLALANSFLEKCNGISYKSDGTKSRELNELLNRLLEAHNNWDNFHHEVPIARQIKKYINEETDILSNIEDKLIKTILICRIGNGKWYCDGVSPGAKPIYNEIIRLFNSKQINKLIKFLTEPEIRNMLSINNCILHTKELLGLINLDLQDGRTREAIECILNHIDTAKSRVFSVKELKDLMKHI
ncbi:hypothetical protein PDJ96_14850 [Bacillus cereus group sp. BY17LC]|uniref:hypothetical protein n=1 Tax=Bacillus TaxID=1386 RepID=UPI0022E21CFD|nr:MULTISPECIES: hypothetical protein [unclassified Bacillus cereus group]MDA1577244.1 hypothetical protein [Bacillus cereus group sp. TH228LC]MDA1837996.1 hypothetical protein [Bacillus cereus group sp. BY17LC]